MRYVSLHHHSTFSHGDGHKLPAVHVARAAELGYTALALTEHGGTSSHFQFEKAALKAGVKPIFGLEAYTGPTDENRSQWKYHLTILAENNDGYRNLNQLVTQSWRDFHYHPTVSGPSLQRYSEGLVILSGCTGSLLACALVGGKGIPAPTSRDRYGWDDARRVIERFARLFVSRYYLEVQPFYELEKTCLINPAYERLSNETGVPLVATCDVHYPRPDDSDMQAILHAVHRGNQSIDDAMRAWNYDVPMTFPESDNALWERLVKTGLSRDAAIDAIMNAAYIAEQCNVTLPKAERLVYPISDNDWRPWSLCLMKDPVPKPKPSYGNGLGSAGSSGRSTPFPYLKSTGTSNGSGMRWTLSWDADLLTSSSSQATLSGGARIKAFRSGQDAAQQQRPSSRTSYE